MKSSEMISDVSRDAQIWTVGAELDLASFDQATIISDLKHFSCSGKGKKF
jgi:hypothetical protein